MKLLDAFKKKPVAIAKISIKIKKGPKFQKMAKNFKKKPKTYSYAG